MMHLCLGDRASRHHLAGVGRMLSTRGGIKQEHSVSYRSVG